MPRGLSILEMILHSKKLISDSYQTVSNMIVATAFLLIVNLTELYLLHNIKGNQPPPRAYCLQSESEEYTINYNQKKNQKSVSLSIVWSVGLGVGISSSVRLYIYHCVVM